MCAGIVPRKKKRTIGEPTLTHKERKWRVGTTGRRSNDEIKNEILMHILSEVASQETCGTRGDDRRVSPMAPPAGKRQNRVLITVSKGGKLVERKRVHAPFTVQTSKGKPHSSEYQIIVEKKATLGLFAEDRKQNQKGRLNLKPKKGEGLPRVP